MAKNRITVRIGGIEYPIVGEESEEYLAKVALYVDKKIGEVMRANSSYSTTVASVLTSLIVADEYLKLQDRAAVMAEEENDLRDRLKDIWEEITKLKDKNKQLLAEIEDNKKKMGQQQLEIARLEETVKNFRQK
ncbi:MAG: cell division protein ZapA [Oscillospiraceae bacterium]|nr:cell division protein ZapA [Oscillospiraceae bacterium]